MSGSDEYVSVIGYLNRISELEKRLTTEIVNRNRLEKRINELLEEKNVVESIMRPFRDIIRQEIRDILQEDEKVIVMPSTQAAQATHTSFVTWEEFINTGRSFYEKMYGKTYGWQGRFSRDTGIPVSKVQQARMANRVPIEYMNFFKSVQ